MPDDRSLKTITAGTVKWNLIDNVGSQILYAVTGIVLANVLSQEDFGLVGAVAVFQAFATLLVDSGFSSALIQRQSPTRVDYSSVMWFNIIVATFFYIILWICAPLIARIYQGDPRIIPLSRAIFISMVIYSATIVQSNILMKKMDVSKIAIANFAGLIVGGATGIVLALKDYGPWALVWQTNILAGVRCVVLWSVARWRPLPLMKLSVLRSFLGVASRMMATSFLNVLFQNIYSLVVGNRAGLVPLGYYSQSDKWSKVSVSTLAQVFRASFVPALSEVQDQPERLTNMCYKINRFSAYMVMPLTIGPIVLATPLFHMLFGAKWDASIILFQILIARGAFTVVTSVYNNFLLSVAQAGKILRLEMLRDGLAIAALVVAIPYIAIETPDNPVEGLCFMLYGQLGASLITWVVSLVVTVRAMKLKLRTLLGDMLPYAAFSLIAVPFMLLIVNYFSAAWIGFTLAFISAVAIYIILNALTGSHIQRDVIAYLLRRPID